MASEARREMRGHGTLHPVKQTGVANQFVCNYLAIAPTTKGDYTVNETESIELGRSFVAAIESRLRDRGRVGVYVRLVYADMGVAVVRCYWKEGDRVICSQHAMTEKERLDVVSDLVLQNIESGGLVEAT